MSKKLPWKPQIDEKYYIPYFATRSGDMFEIYRWDNDGVDRKRYDMGIVCKTKEEAIALGQKMLAVAKVNKDNN